MIKTLAKSIREFKRPSILTFILIVGEVIIECIIPFVTADLVNKIKNGVDIKTIVYTGVILAVMAIVSLCCGGLAGVTSAKASAGFARNLRKDIFGRIQTYSFENIDRFSSSSLVTRLTTDITNVQMSYLVIIRTAVRSPLMFVFAIIMAYVMGGKLATTFVIAVPVLAVGLFLISR